MAKILRSINKALLIFLLLTVFIALLIIPARSGDIHLPGFSGQGPGGLWTCYCPSFFLISCSCAFEK